MSRGFCGVGLYSPKTPANFGAVMRAVQCFEADFVAVDDVRDVVGKTATDVRNEIRHTPVFRGDLEQFIPFDCIPFAVEITEDSKPLQEFVHPERAFYIFGPEDGDLTNEWIDRCQRTVEISSNYCLNLAMSVNVVLHDRYVERS